HLFGAIYCKHDSMTRSFHSNDVHAGVRTLIPSHFVQSFDDIRLIEVERFSPGLAGHLQALRDAVDRDHPAGAEHEAAPDSKLPNWAATPHRHRVIGSDIAVLSAHVTGWEDI